MLGGERCRLWFQTRPGSYDDESLIAFLRDLKRHLRGQRAILIWDGLPAGIGHISSHAFRHTYRYWLDAVKTPIAVQQRMMRHTDIRKTMNIYGDVVTDEMSTAGLRVAELAFRRNGAEAERGSS